MSANGVGMPQHALLNAWGQLVIDAFGEDARPYMVGSATTTKQWRDVDVRSMLSPEAWARILPEVPVDLERRQVGGYVYPQWSALCMAVSAWGRAFTGLPIDFQFQPVEWANATYGRGHRRDPLGVRIDPPIREEDQP